MLSNSPQKDFDVARNLLIEMMFRIFVHVFECCEAMLDDKAVNVSNGKICQVYSEEVRHHTTKRNTCSLELARRLNLCAY